MNEAAKSSLDIAISQLCTVGIFFCMRSCEYSETPRHEERKTKILCIKNIRFFNNNSEVDHSSQILEDSSSVSVTFEDQKNREKFETITMYTNDDKVLNPVRAWSNIVKRVLSYPKASKNSQVNLFLLDNKHFHISSKNVLTALRSTVRTIGSKELGFSHSEIGTHSLRSGGAMALYLGGCGEAAIKLTGRWKSDSFMKYIRKQVQQFSIDFSSKMMRVEHFSHVPEYKYSDSPTQK